MNIVVGYWRGDQVSNNILNLAAHHAKVFNARLYVVTSLKGGGAETSQELDQAENNLNYAIEYLKGKGVEAEQKLLIRGVSAGEDIVRFAEDNNAEEVIVGVVKVSKVGKLLMGSTAQYIILNASCPVVSVR